MKIEIEVWSIENGQLKEIKIGDKVFVLQEKRQVKSTKRTYRRKMKKKATNAVFSKKYYTWVKPEEIREVKRCISLVKYGYRPTTTAISGESRMKPVRVRAVLDVLLKQGVIYKKMKGKVPIYHFVSSN